MWIKTILKQNDNIKDFTIASFYLKVELVLTP